MSTPSHEDLAGYLRCLIFDLDVLATSTEHMMLENDPPIVESHKTSALVKLRAVYDFFFRPEASDSIKLAMFQVYDLVVPLHRTKDWDESLTHQSINTYVVHLDVERVSKTVPQPKFARGERAILRTAVEFMSDAEKFVESVMAHDQFVGLNSLGKKWHAHFIETLKRLKQLVNDK